MWRVSFRIRGGNRLRVGALWTCEGHLVSRLPWLGRPTGRHAAPPRGRNRARAGGESAAQGAAPAGAAPRPLAPPDAAYLLGAPTVADAPAGPLVSPVTDAAR